MKEYLFDFVLYVGLVCTFYFILGAPLWAAVLGSLVLTALWEIKNAVTN